MGIFWQRMWLDFVPVLELFLRLNLKSLGLMAFTDKISRILVLMQIYKEKKQTGQREVQNFS